ncbi:hypothetical protein [Pseudoroseicyclus aestuarii]|uniref:Uncharacterized protein n=1 Tax=Pseudoroseicyclus aestuarii TaxID=1795041 RepID=A0A318T1Z3_9RHOB|nr:hypothetical protein [Pseudoroseicyclus aestuarii]PYE85997.1 hypothetical protein DFP88_101672 [Pseudoroseicyclus aestuarii]
MPARVRLPTLDLPAWLPRDLSPEARRLALPVAGAAGAALLVVLMLLLLPRLQETRPLSSSGDDAARRIVQHIDADGGARFLEEGPEGRRTVWTVTCRVPLRGCIARAPGLVLSMDNRRRPWIIASASPRAQLAIEAGGDRQPAPGLFGAPVPEALLEQLSLPDAALVIEEPDEPAQMLFTAGADSVAAYLGWLQGDAARRSRDARTWPGHRAEGVPSEPGATEPQPELAPERPAYGRGASLWQTRAEGPGAAPAAEDL